MTAKKICPSIIFTPNSNPIIDFSSAGGNGWQDELLFHCTFSLFNLLLNAGHRVPFSISWRKN